VTKARLEALLEGLAQDKPLEEVRRTLPDEEKMGKATIELDGEGGAS